YSLGASWDISKEGFYRFALLPYLKVRATYGYNGNVDNNLTAYTTATYRSGTGTLTSLPYAIVDNPPNPELRWERDKIVNLAIDFGTKNNVINGSLEYYKKTGI